MAIIVAGMFSQNFVFIVGMWIVGDGVTGFDICGICLISSFFLVGSLGVYMHTCIHTYTCIHD